MDEGLLSSGVSDAWVDTHRCRGAGLSGLSDFSKMVAGNISSPKSEDSALNDLPK